MRSWRHSAPACTRLSAIRGLRNGFMGTIQCESEPRAERFQQSSATAPRSQLAIPPASPVLGTHNALLMQLNSDLPHFLLHSTDLPVQLSNQWQHFLLLCPSDYTTLPLHLRASLKCPYRFESWVSRGEIVAVHKTFIEFRVGRISPQTCVYVNAVENLLPRSLAGAICPSPS